MQNLIVTIIVGYLLGCIQTSYLLTKILKGKDIRELGTGNAGATNMVWVYGWSIGTFTVIVDILKASLAVYLVQYISIDTHHLQELQYLAGSMAIIGHVFPFYMKFKGGKGFASFLGMFLMTDPQFGFILTGLAILCTMILNSIAIGSVVLMFGVPIYLHFSGFLSMDSSFILFGTSLICIIKHSKNISKYLKGKEPKFWDFMLKHNSDKLHFIIDFDSTFIQVETLDELAKISLADDPDQQSKINQIQTLTDQAMDGDIDFISALNQRLKILNANQSHIVELISQLKGKISTSFELHREFITDNSINIYIVSGGFTEVILPIVSNFNIPEDQIFANRFLYNGNGNIIGFDDSQIMATKPGKIEAVRSLQLRGMVIVIGDGYTDYQIKKAGLAHHFIAYTESISRPNVIKKGDFVATSFDDVINIVNSLKK